MKETYLNILQHLSTVSELRWIDANKGQLMSETRPALAFPACLIKLEITDSKTTGANVQVLTIQVTLSLIFTFVGNTALQTPEQIREESLAYFDTVQNTYLALQGKLNHDGRPYERTSQREQEGEAIKVVNLTFKTFALDQSAA